MSVPNIGTGFFFLVVLLLLFSSMVGYYILERFLPGFDAFRTFQMVKKYGPRHLLIYKMIYWKIPHQFQKEKLALKSTRSLSILYDTFSKIFMKISSC